MNIEDGLELLFGRGDEPFSDGAIGAIDVLEAHEYLPPDRAALWRARFERAARLRPPLDQEMRARCLKLIEQLPDDDTMSLAWSFCEAGLLNQADLESNPYGESSYRYHAPLRIALGPPRARTGPRVIWIATYDDRIELGLSDLRMEPGDRHLISLRDCGDTEYIRCGPMFNTDRGRLRFGPKPPTPTVDLVLGEQVIELDVPQ
jgi:hypothetical protein